MDADSICIWGFTSLGPDSVGIYEDFAPLDPDFACIYEDSTRLDPDSPCIYKDSISLGPDSVGIYEHFKGTGRDPGLVETRWKQVPPLLIKTDRNHPKDSWDSFNSKK